MDRTYHQALRLLKSSFVCHSETESVVRSLACGREGPIKILDVGIGDGEHARKLIAGLRNYSLRPMLTGVDIYDECAGLDDIEVIQGDFMKVHLVQEYHAVNATQSLYYFSPIGPVLSKMIDITLPGGIVVVTIWGETCLLYKLHELLMHSIELWPAVHTSDVVHAVREHPRTHSVCSQVHQALLDPTLLQTEAGIAALTRVAARSPITDAEIARVAPLVESFLSHGELLPRVNTVICVNVD